MVDFMRMALYAWNAIIHGYHLYLFKIYKKKVNHVLEMEKINAIVAIAMSLELCLEIIAFAKKDIMQSLMSQFVLNAILLGMF